MSSIRDFLANLQKDYTYCVKSIHPLEPHMKRIELCLERFDVKSCGAVFQTPIQRTPLDFGDSKNCEVYFFSFITTRAHSTAVMREALVRVLNCPEKDVLVRLDSDPLEQENERFNRVRDEEYVTKLSTSPDYQPNEVVADEQLFGDGFTQEFLKKLSAVRAERC